MGDSITSLNGLEGKTVEINAHVGDDGKIVSKLADQNGVEYTPVSEGKFLVPVSESLVLTPTVKSRVEAYAVVYTSENGSTDDTLEFRYDSHREDYPADHTFDCLDTGTVKPG